MRKVFLSVFALFLAVLIASCGPAADENVMCTVTFIPNNGEDAFTRDVVPGNVVTEPTVGYEGFRLDGWYRDSSFTELWNFDTPVNSDISLYAYWEPLPKEYRVTYYNDAGDVVGTATVLEGFLTNEPAVDEVRDGFVFLGWYEEGAEEPFDFMTQIHSDIKLIQRWEREENVETCIVSLYIDGELYLEERILKGRTFNLPYPESDGYTFDGWYSDRNLTIYVFDRRPVIEQDTLFYGIWEQIPKPSDSGFLYIENDDETLTITGLENPSEYEGVELVIPSQIDGRAVTVIGNSAFSSTGITKVVFSENIIEIEDNAFRYCRALTEAVLNEGLQSIGYRAFASSGLVEIVIPDTVKVISDEAFSSTQLETIILGDGIISLSSSAFEYCRPKSIDTGNAINSLDDFDISSIEKIIFGDAFRETGSFSNSELKEVVFGKNIEVISDNAFRGCFNLETMIIPDGVKSIGAYAFAYSHLSNITIPDSVAEIGEYAFTNTYLSSVNFGSGLTSIPNGAFQDNTMLPSVEIPENIVTIGAGAFKGCTYLTDVTFHNALQSIGDEAFYEAAVTSVTIPDSLTELGSSVFRDCSSLAHVEIGAGITSIPPYTFYGCDSLEGIDLPDNIIAIGENSFSNSSLKAITISDSVTSIGDRAFYQSDLKEIILGDELDFISSTAFEYCYPTYLDTGNAIDSVIGYFETDNIETLIVGDRFTTCSGLNLPALKNLTLGKGITEISDHAFSGAGIESIKMLGDVTRIGKEAFIQSNLTSISIPDTVREIDYCAFANCYSLASIDFGMGVETIGDRAFNSCRALKDVFIPGSVRSIGTYAFAVCTALSEVDFGNGMLDSIGEYAFSETAITSIEIPFSVNELGAYAFYDEYSSLKAPVIRT